MSLLSEEDVLQILNIAGSPDCVGGDELFQGYLGDEIASKKSPLKRSLLMSSPNLEFHPFQLCLNAFAEN